MLENKHVGNVALPNQRFLVYVCFSTPEVGRAALMTGGYN